MVKIFFSVISLSEVVCIYLTIWIFGWQAYGTNCGRFFVLNRKITGGEIRLLGMVVWVSFGHHAADSAGFFGGEAFPAVFQDFVQDTEFAGDFVFGLFFGGEITLSVRLLLFFFFFL